jgi:hypothetical protein
MFHEIFRLQQHNFVHDLKYADEAERFNETLQVLFHEVIYVDKRYFKFLIPGFMKYLKFQVLFHKE